MKKTILFCLFLAVAVVLEIGREADAFSGMGTNINSPAASPKFEGTVTVGQTLGSGSVWLYDASGNASYKLAGNSYLYAAAGGGLASGSSTTAASGVDLFFTRQSTQLWKITSDATSEWADLKLRNLTTAATLSELAPSLIEANWTHGTGWENPIVGPGLIKSADGTGTQTTTAATTIVAGTTYKVVITLSAISTGSASYTLGGVTGASSLAAVTTYTDYITATTTGKIIITPTNTSRFTISAVSYKAMAGGGIVGTTTNDLAVAGNVGEYFSSYVAVGSPISLTNNTGADVTTLTLTAGDWDVEGNINFTMGSATVTATTGGINTTTATIPTDGSQVSSGTLLTTTSDTDGVTLPRKRVLLSTSGTVYLVAKCVFSAGTVAAFGGITARRVR